MSREKKESLYELKERGIKAAYAQGLLRFEGVCNGLAMYTGGGYCFHSHLVPVEFNGPFTTEESPAIYVEAKPKTKREARLMDAEHTLDFTQLLRMPAAHR